VPAAGFVIFAQLGPTFRRRGLVDELFRVGRAYSRLEVDRIESVLFLGPSGVLGPSRRGVTINACVVSALRTGRVPSLLEEASHDPSGTRLLRRRRC
jgi:hypothetical protein